MAIIRGEWNLGVGGFDMDVRGDRGVFMIPSCDSGFDGYFMSLVDGDAVG